MPRDWVGIMGPLYPDLAVLGRTFVKHDVRSDVKDADGIVDII